MFTSAVLPKNTSVKTVLQKGLPMTTPQMFSAQVSESAMLNEKFLHLHFELLSPNRIEFQAGQYALLTVPGSDQKKSYSISSSPEMDHAVELLVDVSPAGSGTTYLRTLKIGDKVSFMAPVGRFIVSEDPVIASEEKSLTFIATGSGIAPIKSMIVDQLRAKQDKRNMVLYWGMRHERDLFMLDKLEELQKGFENFSFHLVLSQAEKEWTLCRGRVTDCLFIHPQLESSGYYICGNMQMVSDVREFLVKQGVEEKRLHFEKFV